MEAVILAAGMGTRIRNAHPNPKVLMEFDKGSCLLNHIRGFRSLGIQKIFVVLGYKGNLVKQFLEDKEVGVDIDFIKNDRYSEWENGYSAYLGLKECSRDVSVVVMGDHLIPYKKLAPAFEDAMKKLNDANLVEFIDTHMETMNPDWCTKVQFNQPNLTSSSKTLKEFDGLDTGLFMLNTANGRFDGKFLSEKQTSNWNDFVLAQIENSSANVVDWGRLPWFGINTQEQKRRVKDWLSKNDGSQYFMLD